MSEVRAHNPTYWRLHPFCFPWLQLDVFALNCEVFCCLYSRITQPRHIPSPLFVSRARVFQGQRLSGRGRGGGQKYIRRREEGGGAVLMINHYFFNLADIPCFPHFNHLFTFFLIFTDSRTNTHRTLDPYEVAVKMVKL